MTNAMMTNTTLMHVNRNMRQLDQIIRQIETGKRASRPSDNPLVASRALQFRTSVHENEQFRRLVDQGMSWMNVTESTFTNINQTLLREIRNLAVTGANDTNTLSQKQTIIAQMRSLFEEIGTSVNHTFNGQHLFSGFRTDQPPTFVTDNNYRFVITQHFNLSDVSRERSFQRIYTTVNPSNPGGTPSNIMQAVVHDISVLKLAYAEISTEDLRPAGTAASPPITAFLRHVDAPAGIHIPGFHVRKVSINDPQAYIPPQTFGDLRDDNGNPIPLPNPQTTPPTTLDTPVIHLVAETGELVMHGTTANNFPREGVSVTFEKQGFRRGDLNPAVYFTSRKITDTSVPDWSSIGSPGSTAANTVHRLTQYFSRASGTGLLADGVTNAPPGTAPAYFLFELAYLPDFAGQVEVPVNSGNWRFTDSAEDLRPQLPAGAVLLPNGTVRVPAHLFESASDISVTYSVSNLRPQTPPVTPPIPNSPPDPFTGLGNPAGQLLPEGVDHIKNDLRIQGVQLVRAHTPFVDANNRGGIHIPLETVDRNHSFDMHNQDIQYEFSTRTLVTVNSLAKNLLTDKMFGDFRRLFEFADSIQITPRSQLEQHFYNLGYRDEDGSAGLTNAVNDALIAEESLAVAALFAQFDNMLFLIDRHADQSTREQTLLGTRMVRLDLIQDRLEQDEVAYNRLMSDNEDTDLIRATILRMSAEAAFLASLRANSGVVQMSLANFMR